MSYGQPCKRSTVGPLAGPASAYPTLRRPAPICFRGANDVFVPGLVTGRSARITLLDRGRMASAKGAPGASIATPADRPAVAKRRRDIASITNVLLNYLVRRSAEREVKDLRARIEKLNLTLAIGDRCRLANELVEPLLDNRAVPRTI